MRWVFFGTPTFAATILEKLIAADLPPAIVVTNPDRPVGRKKVITPPPAKITAQKHGLTVLQPENLLGEDFMSKLTGWDYLIVAAYARIIPQQILELPRLGVIGVHPSLLPRHRGASPIQSAILSGDSETGVTLYLMDEEVDHGPTIAKSKIQIPKSKTYIELLRELAGLAGELLIETLPKFIRGEITPVPQSEAEATYTKKITAQDAYVDLEKDDPVLIERKIRALNPEPGVWTVQNGKRVKLLEAELLDGKLKLKKIQLEGQKPKVI